MKKTPAALQKLRQKRARKMAAQAKVDAATRKHVLAE